MTKSQKALSELHQENENLRALCEQMIRCLRDAEYERDADNFQKKLNNIGAKSKQQLAIQFLSELIKTLQAKSKLNTWETNLLTNATEILNYEQNS